MSRDEIARRLAAADRERAKLRRATREMRKLGEHVRKQKDLLELFARLKWDAAYDYKAERS